MNTLDIFFFMRDAALRFTAIAVGGQDRHLPAPMCQLLGELIHMRGARHIVRKEEMVQEQNRRFVCVVYVRHDGKYNASAIFGPLPSGEGRGEGLLCRGCRSLVWRYTAA